MRSSADQCMAMPIMRKDTENADIAKFPPNYPRFSVIVPTHNGADRLDSSLSSVSMQTYRNYELIVVCDACTDRSAEIASKYADQVIEVNHRRDGLSRNAGLDAATGDWILFLDDDDWFLHEFVFDMLADKIRNDIDDDVSVIDFSFAWRGRGYYVPSSEQCFSMVWCRAWKRSFIGDNRFNNKPYGSDSDFFDRHVKNNPDCKICFYDSLMYYYNYFREGSLSYNMAQNTSAKLDIIITHYNEPWEVGRKLFDSIYLQECCDYRDVNIILVQDGEDNALPWHELFKDYPFSVKVLTIKEQRGVATARNAGIEHATSDWIMFMDFDDIFADAATFSQIAGLFPVTDDVDIIWCKYVREVNGHGRLDGVRLNCEDNPDFRLIGKLYRRAFLNEHRIRFITRHQEYCDLLFNTIALSETYDFKFVNFNAPFYPFIKRLREDGAFSTIATLEQRTAGLLERNIILAEEMGKRNNMYKYGIWIARAIIDSYHSIISAESEPDGHYGITEQLIDFWKQHRNDYMSVSPVDIEVAMDESQEEVMTYIQSYYNDFGREYYLQNDMISLGQYIAILDEYASGVRTLSDTSESQEAQQETQQEEEHVPVPQKPYADVTPIDDPKTVVYCGTKETYVNMIASVKSLLATTPVDEVYFLTEDDVFPYELPEIVHTINVKPFAFETFDRAGPNFTNVWTYMCLMRTAFPQLFPKHKKILSLDIDVVITEDISCLWDIDLTDYYFAGVEEQGRLKDNGSDFYANFGVIMMNLEKMRNDGMGDKLIQAVNTEHFCCPEQDAFNKYCKGQIYKLPNDYNVTVYSHITGEPLKERILHYAGLKYWKHFGPVKKYYNLSWDEIMKLQEGVRHG